MTFNALIAYALFAFAIIAFPDFKKLWQDKPFLGMSPLRYKITITLFLGFIGFFFYGLLNITAIMKESALPGVFVDTAVITPIVFGFIGLVMRYFNSVGGDYGVNFGFYGKLWFLFTVFNLALLFGPDMTTSLIILSVGTLILTHLYDCRETAFNGLTTHRQGELWTRNQNVARLFWSAVFIGLWVFVLLLAVQNRDHNPDYFHWQIVVSGIVTAILLTIATAARNKTIAIFFSELWVSQAILLFM